MFLRCFVVACTAVQTLAFAQTSMGVARNSNPWVSVAQPNVPPDASEVVANAEPVQGVEQRAAAMKVISTAQYLSNVRRMPYDLKTTFNSVQGSWQIEDSSPGRSIYRWTVQGPSYSAINLFLDRVIYSNQPATGIPLRVAQVHSAIFGHFPGVGPRSTLRMAAGNLNGRAVTCVLSSNVFQGRAVSGPRRWEEYETCADTQSGLLMSYSPVPGIYVAYDYSNAHHLGDVTFPGKFTISEAGQIVVEAQVTSLTQPGNAQAAAYTSNGLTALGVGFPLTQPWRMQNTEFVGNPVPNPSAGQFVVVRAMAAPDGSLTEAEVVASSNPGFNQKALERAAQRHPMMAAPDDQSGTTPQSHEAFFLTLFVTN